MRFGERVRELRQQRKLTQQKLAEKLGVAALTAGKWTEQQKTDLALEYYTALKAYRSVPPQDKFLRDWHLCRLHLAVQWLGWSSDWSPPSEHQQDWLAEVVESANRLKLSS